MSIKFLYSSEKTNSYRPVPWHWSTEKFPAYRGNGWQHRGFLAVAGDYPAPLFTDGVPSADDYRNPTVSFEPSASKLIKTKEKGTLMLVPCESAEDEQIMLTTLRGGFRGGYSRIEAVGAGVLFQKTSGGHCVVTGHMVIRLTHPKGYVFAETGRRCSSGLVEIFSWDGYQTMPTEEFEVWRTSQAPDVTDRSVVPALKAEYEEQRKAAVARAIQKQANRDAKVKAEANAKAKAEAASAAAKLEGLGTRMEDVNNRRKVVGQPVFELGDIHFGTRVLCSPDLQNPRLYTEANVSAAEGEATQLEEQAALKAALQELRADFGPTVEDADCVLWITDFNSTWHKMELRAEDVGLNRGFEYSLEGINDLTAAWPEFLSEVNAKRLEQQGAAYEVAKSQAAKAGLPQNIQIWKRTGGRTNAGCGWVISPDGMDRESTSMWNTNPRRLQRYGEGYMVWEQIIHGEVVLQWSKGSSAAPHEFAVVHLPKGGLTEAQLERITEIQTELEDQWAGARGLASGLASPPVGEGWGLLPNSTPTVPDKVVASASPEEPARSVSDGGSAASAASLQDLVEKFKR